MRHLPQFAVPIGVDGLPVEPTTAFDLLADLLLNVVTAAQASPTTRRAICERAQVFMADLEGEVFQASGQPVGTMHA